MASFSFICLDEFFMMPINGTTGTEAPSCHGKCCISEEQLKDLENKINEVSQSLKFIKGETL